MLRLEYTPYTLEFKFNARTSRGSMKDRTVWFLKVTNSEGVRGIGEVAPINRLSPEDPEDVPEELDRLANDIKKLAMPASSMEVSAIVRKLVPISFPSIRCGLEMALLDLLNGGKKEIFSNDLGSIDIPINGLIWMGNRQFMKDQITQKLDQGYRCIKLKVGSLDFETELVIIKELRKTSDELIIRLDANGAFQTNEVLAKLKQLSKFNIHSIEQPILPMQPEALEIVCSKSQIPIALDEELIWITNEKERLQLLQEIHPHYLVLKPTLHGGFDSVRNWIDLAEIQGIDWWITSYLESNIGLNAIAQFTSQFDNELHHGLGTGGLYTNNIASPLKVENGHFRYNNATWAEVVV